MFDVIEIGIIVTQNKGVVVDINPFARQIMHSCLNFEPASPGMDICETFQVYPEWVSLLEQNAYGTLEIQVQGTDDCFVEIRVYPLQSNSGHSIGAVSLLRDVTQLRKQEFTLRTRAETDFLTSLMNRDRFLREFHSLMNDNNVAKMPVSVLMMDLDKFKSINDAYGHDAGDRVLVAIADVLRATLRQGDAIARIGGDEFAAVLPNVGKHDAAVIAERIIQTAGERLVAVDAQTSVPLKLSIGICDNSETSSADEMLKRADQAMYAAKFNAKSSQMD